MLLCFSTKSSNKFAEADRSAFRRPRSLTNKYIKIAAKIGVKIQGNQKKKRQSVHILSPIKNNLGKILQMR